MVSGARENADRIRPLIPDAVARIGGNRERSRDIAARVLDGEPLSSVGASHGLSVERVRQIATKVFAKAERLAALAKRAALPGDVQIQDLDLSVRTRNCLRNQNVRTVADLRKYVGAHGMNSLLRTPNFGRKSLNELREFLDSAGLGVEPPTNEERIIMMTYRLGQIGARLDYMSEGDIGEHVKAIRTVVGLGFKDARGETDPETLGQLRANMRKTG